MMSTSGRSSHITASPAIPAGKVNDNYLLTSYKDMLNSGDNAPVLSAGDSQSLLLKLITGHTGVDPKTGQRHPRDAAHQAARPTVYRYDHRMGHGRHAADCPAGGQKLPLPPQSRKLLSIKNPVPLRDRVLF